MTDKDGNQELARQTDRHRSRLETPNAKVSSKGGTQVQPEPFKVSCHFISFTLDLCSSMVIPVAKFCKTTVDPLTPKTKYGPVLRTNNLLLFGLNSKANMPGANVGSGTETAGNVAL